MALVLAVLAATPLPVAGQASRVLRGRVLSEATGAPLGDAEVVLMDEGRLARTAENGGFQLLVPDGDYRIQVRRIGYVARAFRFRTRSDTMEVEFTLTPSAVTLDSITVTGRSPAVSPRLAEFDRRRRLSATGQFLGLEELAPLQDRRLGDALRRIRGIRIVPLGGYGQTVVSMRGSGGLDPTGASCYLTVWLDGVLVSAPGRPYDLDRHRVDRLAGIEIYPGAAALPVEFDGGGNPCGALVLWTRDR